MKRRLRTSGGSEKTGEQTKINNCLQDLWFYMDQFLQTSHFAKYVGLQNDKDVSVGNDATCLAFDGCLVNSLLLPRRSFERQSPVCALESERGAQLPHRDPSTSRPALQ